MFQIISNYIQACLRCQEFKGKPDKLRPFHMRIPDSYRPFDKMSLDFKTMFSEKLRGQYGVCVCVCVSVYPCT